MEAATNLLENAIEACTTFSSGGTCSLHGNCQATVSPANVTMIYDPLVASYRSLTTLYADLVRCECEPGWTGQDLYWNYFPWDCHINIVTKRILSGVAAGFMLGLCGIYGSRMVRWCRDLRQSRKIGAKVKVDGFWAIALLGGVSCLILHVLELAGMEYPWMRILFTIGSICYWYCSFSMLHRFLTLVSKPPPKIIFYIVGSLCFSGILVSTLAPLLLPDEFATTDTGRRSDRSERSDMFIIVLFAVLGFIVLVVGVPLVWAMWKCEAMLLGTMSEIKLPSPLPTITESEEPAGIGLEVDWKMDGSMRSGRDMGTASIGTGQWEVIEQSSEHDDLQDLALRGTTTSTSSRSSNRSSSSRNSGNDSGNGHSSGDESHASSLDRQGQDNRTSGQYGGTNSVRPASSSSLSSLMSILKYDEDANMFGGTCIRRFDSLHHSLHTTSNNHMDSNDNNASEFKEKDEDYEAYTDIKRERKGSTSEVTKPTWAAIVAGSTSSNYSTSPKEGSPQFTTLSGQRSLKYGLAPISSEVLVDVISHSELDSTSSSQQSLGALSEALEQAELAHIEGLEVDEVDIVDVAEYDSSNAGVDSQRSKGSSGLSRSKTYLDGVREDVQRAGVQTVAGGEGHLQPVTTLRSLSREYKSAVSPTDSVDPIDLILETYHLTSTMTPRTSQPLSRNMKAPRLVITSPSNNNNNKKRRGGGVGGGGYKTFSPVTGTFMSSGPHTNSTSSSTYTPLLHTTRILRFITIFFMLIALAGCITICCASWARRFMWIVEPLTTVGMGVQGAISGVLIKGRKRR